MKIIAACVGGAALALVGAPQAAADINISGINIGNDGNAHASFGNVAIARPGSTATANGGVLNAAVAISGSTATANGGVGNVALASGGSIASKQGPGSFNLLTAAGQGGSFVVDGNLNVASSLNLGTATATGSNFTFNAAIGSSDIKPSTADSTGVFGSVQTSVCGGTTTSAQGRIEVDAPCLRRN